MKNECEKLINDLEFERAEELIMNLLVSLDELSDEAFQSFKEWIEQTQK
jgi:hypothetical protein